MGYGMRTTESQVMIRAEDKPAALEAVLELMGHTGSMGGGSSDGERWFSFVNNARPSEWETLEDALEDWRWTPETDAEGNIVAIWFRGEKYGDDPELFGVLAPFIQPDSFVRMVGEDGAIWDFLKGDG